MPFVPISRGYGHELAIPAKNRTVGAGTVFLPGVAPAPDRCYLEFTDPNLMRQSRRLPDKLSGLNVNFQL